MNQLPGLDIELFRQHVSELAIYYLYQHRLSGGTRLEIVDFAIMLCVICERVLRSESQLAKHVLKHEGIRIADLHR
jgi:hypothetical protein